MLIFETRPKDQLHKGDRKRDPKSAAPRSRLGGGLCYSTSVAGKLLLQGSNSGSEQRSRSGCTARSNVHFGRPVCAARLLVQRP